MQSYLNKSKGPVHVAIIMDGNGRWATARGRARLVGHGAGADAVRRTVEASPDLGIRTLTLFAFSADNWHRPASEVSGLMRLFDRYLRAEAEACRRNGVRVQVVGRRDRLSKSLLQAVHAVERSTAGGSALWLRLAVDYSGREALLTAARQAPPDASRDKLARLLAGGDRPVPDIDLLIRTGGEQRLSDFMLWESAYAELVFTRCMWPDFGPAELASAVREFRRRERRFGRLPGPPERVEAPRSPDRNAPEVYADYELP